MKADFIVQEKTPETCTFHGWLMMLQKHGALKIFKCWNPVVVFPSPNKISGYVPGCTSSIYEKILWFVFDLIYVVIISLLVAVYIGTDQISIDYHNFLA